MNALQYQNDATIHKHFFGNEAVLDDPISFYFDHLVSTRVSKFDSFIHIAYDSSNPDTVIDLKSRSPLLLGIGGSVGLSVLSYLK